MNESHHGAFGRIADDFGVQTALEGKKLAEV